MPYKLVSGFTANPRIGGIPIYVFQCPTNNHMTDSRVRGFVFLCFEEGGAPLLKNLPYPYAVLLA
ncbi:hypothetical protein ABH899_000015 [Paenibacillus sp. RC84]